MPARCIVFLTISLLTCLHSDAQDRVFRYAFSADFSIPSVVSSGVFNRVFDGISDINTNFKIQTKGGFYTGPGLAFCFLKAGNNRNASLSPFQTKYYVLGPRWSMGYVSGQGNTTQISFGFEAGYSKVFFAGTPCPSTPASPPPFFHAEPSMSIRFFSGENSSFGARLGYSLMWNRFLPEQACLEKFVSYEAGEIRSYAQYIVFGLGFTAYFRPLRPKIKSDS